MPDEGDTDLLNLLSIIAFSVQRSSAGRELACQRSLSSALDRYSVLAMSVRNWKEKVLDKWELQWWEVGTAFRFDQFAKPHISW